MLPLDEIEKKIGYSFLNKELLTRSFVHRSYFNEHKEIGGHNERLEFLGDAVLGLIVSRYLFDLFQEDDEGILSYRRSRLVEACSCASYVQHLDIGNHVLLGKGERLNDGRGRDSILADLFEAIIGALFIDGGFFAAEVFFLQQCLPVVEQIVKEARLNYKAELQELIQKEFKVAPVYKVLKETGPDHNKCFQIAVFAEERLLGEGEGPSKKLAEQKAAEEALKHYGKN